LASVHCSHLFPQYGNRGWRKERQEYSYELAQTEQLEKETKEKKVKEWALAMEKE